MVENPAPDQLELYQRCDEVLHYIWDPLGVAAYPGARSEYHAYLPPVFALVCDGAEENQIVDYLAQVQVDQMGLSSDLISAKIAAIALLEWRDWITRKTP